MGAIKSIARAPALIISMLFSYGIVTLLSVVAAYLAAFIPNKRISDPIHKAIGAFWGYSWFLPARIFFGIRIHIRDKHFLKQNSPCLICPKHQTWADSIILSNAADLPHFILKKEVLRIPILGRALSSIGMPAVNREKPAPSDVRSLLIAAKASIARKQSVLIFPEGTRSPPPDKPLLPGAHLLYSALNVPCIPVALDASSCFSRAGVPRRSGRLILQFLPPILPGLPRKDFLKQLKTAIDSQSDKLAHENMLLRSKPKKLLKPIAFSIVGVFALAAAAVIGARFYVQSVANHAADAFNSFLISHNIQSPPISLRGDVRPPFHGVVSLNEPLNAFNDSFFFSLNNAVFEKPLLSSTEPQFAAFDVIINNHAETREIIVPGAFGYLSPQQGEIQAPIIALNVDPFKVRLLNAELSYTRELSSLFLSLRASPLQADAPLLPQPIQNLLIPPQSISADFEIASPPNPQPHDNLLLVLHNSHAVWDNSYRIDAHGKLTLHHDRYPDGNLTLTFNPTPALNAMAQSESGVARSFSKVLGAVQRAILNHEKPDLNGRIRVAFNVENGVVQLRHVQIPIITIPLLKPKLF